MNPFWRSQPRSRERSPQKCRNVIYPIRCEWLSLRRSVPATTYRITWVATPIRLAFINIFVPSVARNTLFARTSSLESRMQKRRRGDGVVAFDKSASESRPELENESRLRGFKARQQRRSRLKRVAANEKFARLLQQKRMAELALDFDRNETAAI